MDTYNVVGEVLSGKKPMPEVPVVWETKNMILTISVLLGSAMLFLIVKKLI